MKNFLIIITLFFGITAFAQVGIGTTDPEGVLDVVSTDGGIVIPRVANTAAVVNQKDPLDAIPDGTMVYDISASCIKAYEGGAWSDCFSAGGNTSLSVRAEPALTISNADLDGVVLVTGGSGSFNLDAITNEVDGSVIKFVNYNSFTGFSVNATNMASGTTLSTANPAVTLGYIYDAETNLWYNLN